MKTEVKVENTIRIEPHIIKIKMKFREENRKLIENRPNFKEKIELTKKNWKKETKSRKIQQNSRYQKIERSRDKSRIS